MSIVIGKDYTKVNHHDRYHGAFCPMCLTTACSIFVKHKLYDYAEVKSMSHAVSPTDAVPSAVEHDDHNAVMAMSPRPMEYFKK